MTQDNNRGQCTGDLLDSVNGFDVIECQNCKFKHIMPIPSITQLETTYRQEYYSKEKPFYLKEHQEDLEWWNLVYCERYETFEKELPFSRRRLLDVGSGPGFFLLHGKQRGWKTLGIEPSTQAAAHSRGLGLEIVEDFLNEKNAESLGKFDAIHMSEVLEHIPDPAALLSLTRDLLNPGGLLCVVVPNDYNPFQYTLRTACGYKPWWVAPPHHVNYFNGKSLTQLLSKTSFKVILKETTFPIDLFLLMGDNYVGNDALGRACHQKRKQFEKNLDRAGLRNVKRAMYQALSNLDIGREVVLYAKRD